MEEMSEVGCIPTLKVYIFKGEKKKAMEKNSLTRPQKKFISSVSNIRNIGCTSSTTSSFNESQHHSENRASPPMPLAEGALSGLSGNRNFELAATLSSPGSSPNSSVSAPSSRSGSRISSRHHKGSRTEDKKEKKDKKDKKDKDKDKKKKEKSQEKEKEKKIRREKKDDKKKKHSSAASDQSLPSSAPPTTVPSLRSIHPPSASTSTSLLTPRAVAPRQRSHSDAPAPLSSIQVEEVSVPKTRLRSPSVPSAGMTSMPISVSERLLQKRLQRQNGSAVQRDSFMGSASTSFSSSPNPSLSALGASASNGRRRGLSDPSKRTLENEGNKDTPPLTRMFSKDSNLPVNSR